MIGLTPPCTSIAIVPLFCAPATPFSVLVSKCNGVIFIRTIWSLSGIQEAGIIGLHWSKSLARQEYPSLVGGRWLVQPRQFPQVQIVQSGPISGLQTAGLFLRHKKYIYIYDPSLGFGQKNERYNRKGNLVVSENMQGVCSLCSFTSFQKKFTICTVLNKFFYCLFKWLGFELDQQIPGVGMPIRILWTYVSPVGFQ